MENTTTTNSENTTQQNTKFCKHCGAKIPAAAVVCTQCGCQVEEIKHAEQPNIVINNANTNTNTNTNTNVNGGFYGGPRKSKTVALILCIIGFFGFGGLHRMYVGKVGSGILHFFTYGICAIGTIIDLISILSGGFRDSYGQPLV